MNMKILPTLTLRWFGLIKVPLLFSVSPTVITVDDNRCEVKIPFRWWTRNHLKSMYFGALAIGADCAGGLMAANYIRKSGKKISFIFKDFQAEFLKRPEGDTHFVCADGAEIRAGIEEAIRSDQRVNIPLAIEATVPKISPTEPVAKFKLTLSVKAQRKK